MWRPSIQNDSGETGSVLAQGCSVQFCLPLLPSRTLKPRHTVCVSLLIGSVTRRKFPANTLPAARLNVGNVRIRHWWCDVAHAYGPLNARMSSRRGIMLRYALIFLVIALLASAFGMFGLSGVAMEAARILFFVFLVLLVISLITGRRSIGP